MRKLILRHIIINTIIVTLIALTFIFTTLPSKHILIASNNFHSNVRGTSL